MIIDDDADQAEDLADVLRGADHTVAMLHRVEGAVKKLAQDKPDLLILDVMFPEEPSAGLELAIEIRRNDALKELPVILLTGVNREFPLGLSSKDIDPEWMPVQEMVEKPVESRELLRKVDALIGR